MPDVLGGLAGSEGWVSFRINCQTQVIRSLWLRHVVNPLFILSVQLGDLVSPATCVFLSEGGPDCLTFSGGCHEVELATEGNVCELGVHSQREVITT